MSWNSLITRSYVVHPATGSFWDNSTDIADQAWHHIALTIAGGGSGAENTGTIYIDGAAVSTTTRTATYTAPSGTIKVGGNFSSSYWLDGNLDEIGIWDNVALDANAIVQLYNSGAPIDLSSDSGDYTSEFASALTHWWRMGDGDTHPTITDNQGSLDLTMTNMASGDIVEVVPSA